ncbi:hypothetical protein LB467_18130 [Salegentibacter sp. JZCK2]|uniref:DUF6843 domain-containing protein n=1 Tax=Salegentibacter tibetensis TaxID=2873600 RepID=UPI001CCCD84F|nr:hypothetical protein [Salegentibacter tibetensis]MBZ9731609.1 hypothetical protein [Salegentibacter tibetensis]
MRAEIILSIILSFMVLSCDTGEQEIIIAPRDYTGYIIVIFNQEDGKPVKYEGKKRIYEIPSDGVLKTQFNSNDGWSDYPEFYYEVIDPEYKLPSNILTEIETLPMDTIVGFKGATGSIRKNNYDDERVQFAKYYIGTRSDIKRAKEEAEKLDIVKLGE